MPYLLLAKEAIFPEKKERLFVDKTESPQRFCLFTSCQV
jgi:hypothetical protein